MKTYKNIIFYFYNKAIHQNLIPLYQDYHTQLLNCFFLVSPMPESASIGVSKLKSLILYLLSILIFYYKSVKISIDMSN